MIFLEKLFMSLKENADQINPKIKISAASFKFPDCIRIAPNISGKIPEISREREILFLIFTRKCSFSISGKSRVFKGWILYFSESKSSSEFISPLLIASSIALRAASGWYKFLFLSTSVSDSSFSLPITSLKSGLEIFLLPFDFSVILRYFYAFWYQNQKLKFYKI